MTLVMVINVLCLAEPMINSSSSPLFIYPHAQGLTQFSLLYKIWPHLTLRYHVHWSLITFIQTINSAFYKMAT